jgi:hypothetical protein
MVPAGPAADTSTSYSSGDASAETQLGCSASLTPATRGYQLGNAGSPFVWHTGT